MHVVSFANIISHRKIPVLDREFISVRFHFDPFFAWDIRRPLQRYFILLLMSVPRHEIPEYTELEDVDMA